MTTPWRWTVSGVFLDNTSFEEIIRICQAAGVVGIEGAPELFEGKSERELEEIREVFHREGLGIHSFHLPYTDQDDISSFYETSRREAVQSIRSWMRRAWILGASVCIQHPTTNQTSTEVEGFDPFMRQLTKSLEVLLPDAEALGLMIALENTLPRKKGRFASTPEHLQLIMEACDHPRLGFCLDTGHTHIAAHPSAAIDFFDVLGERLVTFHIQDNAGDRESHLAPGRGLLDWKGIFRRIADMAFCRPVCIEAPPFAPGIAYGSHDAESWRVMIEETDRIVSDALDRSEKAKS